MTENAAQLFARLEGRRCLKDIEPCIFPEDGGPNYGDVVELHGTEGTGKTELLYHLLVRCLLPGDVGGLCVEVVFLDTDHHFDMLRLVTVLEHRLAQATRARTSEEGCESSGGQGQATATSDPETRVRACLSRLSVVHCSSSAQLLLTLHFLETSMCSRPKLSLLIIDSISAFYWTDRSGGGDSVAKQEVTLRKCSELLARLLRDYRISVFASTHAIMRNYGNWSSDRLGESSDAASSWRKWSSAQGSDYDRLYLCKAWQRLVTHRLLLARAETGPGTREQRHVFSATSTSSTSYSSSNRPRGVRNFSFVITDEGLSFM
ncbi:DNA repair protein XRCC2 isoform X1 [Osmerus mordax]|uniref:DNA repair protein XRCC2 isoform X1 n=1 Tax=Osmerus mordax TaxID=8014 RepID=UPI00350F6208